MYMFMYLVISNIYSFFLYIVVKNDSYSIIYNIVITLVAFGIRIAIFAARFSCVASVTSVTASAAIVIIA